jgi:hypothetical protein
VVHHDRKAEADDPFDTVSGSLGLTGAADTILILKRQTGGVTLYARGRDIEERETALHFEKTTCRWSILGEASASSYAKPKLMFWCKKGFCKLMRVTTRTPSARHCIGISTAH